MKQHILQVSVLVVTATAIISLILGCHREDYKPPILTVDNSSLTLETSN